MIRPFSPVQERVGSRLILIQIPTYLLGVVFQRKCEGDERRECNKNEKMKHNAAKKQ